MGASSAKLQVRALHKAIEEWAPASDDCVFITSGLLPLMTDDPTAVREGLEEDCSLVNVRGDEGWTALHVAVSRGALKALKVILENEQLNVTMATISRETPLILATSCGQEEAALQLLTALPPDRLEVCAEDGKGLQAVHHAAEQGLVRLVTALLEGGAAAEARDSRLRLTPLMIAAQHGQTEVLRLLLDNGAQAGSVDLAHMTALHHACLASAGGCVDHLLAQPGTVLDSRDVSGCTALLYCLKNKNRNLEKLLISHGASLTAALDSGFSELCYHTVQESS